jgi:bacillolysin
MLKETWHRADYAVPDAVARSRDEQSRSDATSIDFIATTGLGTREAELSVTKELAVAQLVGFAADRSVPLDSTDLRWLRTLHTPSGTSVWCFAQQRNGVDVFGRQATIELDGAADMVSVDVDLALDVPDLPPAVLTADDALSILLAEAGVSSREEECSSSQVIVFDAKSSRWRRAFRFADIPFGRHNSSRARSFDAFVDDTTGEIVLWYASAVGVSMPVECECEDEQGNIHVFHGTLTDTGTVEMRDPLWGVTTYDLGFRDIANAHLLPLVPVSHIESKHPPSNSAAAQAQSTVVGVVQLLQSLVRNSALGDGSDDIRLVVNCTDSLSEPPPQWRNAIWWKKRLWFGQTQLPSGQLETFAKHVDVASHELMHGVIERTSGLEYRDQSAALAESLCDIFGVVVANCLPHGIRKSDIREWSWLFGVGVHGDNRPMKDLSNPRAYRYAAHMAEWRHGEHHYNSGIGSLAAYNFATSGIDGFSAYEFAILYYVSSSQLAATAEFADLLRILVRSVKTLWEGNASRCEQRLNALRIAYSDVGISE